MAANTRTQHAAQPCSKGLQRKHISEEKEGAVANSLCLVARPDSVRAGTHNQGGRTGQPASEWGQCAVDEEGPVTRGSGRMLRERKVWV